MNDIWHEEWVIVYDGDPKMDGGHERRECGRFSTREQAVRGLEIVKPRSRNSPKPNLRIEHRRVTAWEADS